MGSKDQISKQLTNIMEQLDVHGVFYDKTIKGRRVNVEIKVVETKTTEQ